MRDSDYHRMRARAVAHDEGRHAMLALAMVAAAASVAAIISELSGAKGRDQVLEVFSVLLTASTIALSWFFVHLVFAIHYAHGLLPGRRGRWRRPSLRPGIPGRRRAGLLGFPLFLRRHRRDVTDRRRQHPLERAAPHRHGSQPDLVRLQHRDPGDDDQPGGGAVLRLALRRPGTRPSRPRPPSTTGPSCRADSRRPRATSTAAG